MNNRIYPRDAFEKAMKDLLDGKYYCPNCLCNDLDYSDRETGIIYIDEFKCYSCMRIFNSTLRLSKQEVRDKKIDRVLGK